MSADPTFALSMAVVAAAACLGVFHMLDVHEKEPAWAVALVTGLGLGGGVGAARLVEESFQQRPSGGALTACATMLLALAAGTAVFAVLGRERGWSELNGLMDGIVYGAAAGLGVALGGVFVDELDGTALTERLTDQTGAYALVWDSIRSTISHGLAGALIGAGIGAAFEARQRRYRWVLPPAGVVVAVVVHYVYLTLATRTEFFAHELVALLVPAAIVGVTIWQGLTSERDALRELEGEPATVVTPQELATLRSPATLRREYMRHFGAGDLETWERSRALRNRQLQLALTKRSLAGNPREEPATEPLRRSIEEIRATLRRT